MPNLGSNFLSSDAGKQPPQLAPNQPPTLPPSKTSLNPKGVKSAKINACGELYQKLSINNPLWYRSAPKGVGIDFEVAYYDTLELLPQQVRETAPTLCLLHGAPGHYSDFSDLIIYLTSKGCRVVAPCFPNHEAVFEHSFRHSPVERADYLRSFFEVIKLKHFDMMLGHSSSIYTIFELLAQILASPSKQLTISSIGLFSTLSYALPPNAENTFWRLLALKMFDYPLLRPFLNVITKTFAHMAGIKNKTDKIDNMVLTASAVGHSAHEKLESRLGLVRQFQVPTFMIYGCLDKLIPVEYFEQLVDGLKVSKNQVKTYDKDGELLGVVEGLEDDLVQVSRYLDGGHYAFHKYSKQVNEDLYRFLVNKVIERTSQDDQMTGV